jgi:hypothetical protein
MIRTRQALLSDHVGVAVVVLFLMVTVAIGAGTFLAADRARSYAPPASTTLTPAPTALPPDARVVITKAMLVSESSLRVELTAKQISGDWLMEPPLLQIGDKKISPSAASLKATRFSFLNAVTAGEAAGALEFEIEAALRSSRRGSLVFNPSSQSLSIVAPRLEVGFEWGKLAVATATPLPSGPASDPRVAVNGASFVSETRLRVDFTAQSGLLLYAEAPLLTIGDANLLPTAESFKAFTALAAGKRLALEFDLDVKAKEAGRGSLIFNPSSQAWSGGMSPRIEVIVTWK